MGNKLKWYKYTIDSIDKGFQIYIGVKGTGRPMKTIVDIKKIWMLHRLSGGQNLYSRP